MKQIITKGPSERYLVDLINIKDNINDKNPNYKYFLDIITHYSKLVWSYLLNTKNTKEVLTNINEFICINGVQKNLQNALGK